jgi:hypothetical protein
VIDRSAPKGEVSIVIAASVEIASKLTGATL